MSYAEESLKRLVGKAIMEYGLIGPDEKVVVGVSGKDSILMYLLLSERLRRTPIAYHLLPVFVDLGFDQTYTNVLIDLLKRLEIPCEVISTEIGKIAHSSINRENPCFFCAWNRRKILFKYADEVGAKKIALGHHRDDVIVTFLMGLFYSGNLTPIYPKQDLFGGRLSIIRPLYMVGKDLIIKSSLKRGISLPPYPCPTSGKTKRSEIELFIETLAKLNKKVKGNIFNGIQRLIRG